ncbi:hypothetical protein SEUCBS139899_003860 [Sporothrix eucalyptigena]
MGVDAEELIVRPFREVVERGHEAVANAEAESDGDVDAETLTDMVKAGRAVVREGERALKRLQPMWDGQVEKYGDAFKDTMLQQDDIERRRRELEDLLYDFEDYTEPQSFDPSKFAELQAATRSFALDVISHTKRLKLESPKRASTATSSTSTLSKTSAFPPLPPLPASMSLPRSIPPIPPMSNLTSLPAISGSDGRSRSSSIKATAASIPRSPSLAHSPHTTSSEMVDGDDQLFKATSRSLTTPATADAPSVHGMPSPARASASHRSLRRPSTKSPKATSMTSASSRGAVFLDHAERYQVYDHLEGQDQQLWGSNDEVERPGTHPTPPPSIPRTSAWVRSHQQQLHQLQQLQRLQQLQNLQQYQQQHPHQHSHQHPHQPQSPRGKASRETVATVATDYSSGSATHDSPMILSRFNSLTVDGSVRSAVTSATTATATTVTTASTSPSQILTETARTSYLSSAAPSYTSSLAMTFATPPLSFNDNSKHAHATASSDSAPFIAPPIAPLSTRAIPPSHAPSQSIQDFIKFAPSPPVPPISLPLLPKHRPRPRDDDDDLEGEHDHDHDHGGEPIMLDAEMDELEERTRPAAWMGANGHQSSVRLDWKPRVPESTGDRIDRGDRNTVAASGMASLNLSPSIPSGLSEKNYDHGLMVVGDEVGDEVGNKLAPLAQTKTAGTAKTSVREGGATDDSATIDTATTDLPLTGEFVRDADCSIGPKSTFETMGGFCKDADLYRTSDHWAGIKKAGGFVTNEQATEVTFSKVGGARFRPRLLYKSHVRNTVNSQRHAEGYYACIFCVHVGATVREGDATVFTTADHLLLHIARHPQPLPIVPGVTVVYGNERGTNGAPGGASSFSGMSSVSSSTDPIDANDFDLHLVNPPLPTPVPPTVSQAAVATALRDHIYHYGAKRLARPPGYGGDMLYFLAGARIVGLMFPEKWEGKWCMGWHDGFVGAFPATAVQIEPPRQNEIPVVSNDSGMSVTARWKWKPNEGRNKEGKDGKDGKDGDSGSSIMTSDNAASVWLSFEKGETISDVKCLYADHWCWAGTNSKGRFGVFPQSHIITKTLAPLRPAKTGWSTKSLFKGNGNSGSGGASRPPSSSAA